jgi:proteasome accessory factor C
MNTLQDRLRRLLFIVPYVTQHPEGVPKAELAANAGVDVPTLERDLDLLLMVGRPDGGPDEFIDIYCDEDGRVKVDADQGLSRPPRLTVPEAFALLAGARALRGAGIKPYDEVIDRASAKIRSALGEAGDALVVREAEIVIDGADPAGLRVVPLLARAAEEHTTVEVDYYSAGRGETTRRRIDPYGLVDHLGWWYLVGYCHKHQQARLFKCERISHCELTPEHFAPPADFDLERYRRDWLLFAPPDTHHVVLRLRGRAADRLGTWEGARRLDDGRLEISFDNPGLEWLCGWVLSLGPEAEVAAPEVLREAVAERARRIAGAHVAMSAHAT